MQSSIFDKLSALEKEVYATQNSRVEDEKKSQIQQTNSNLQAQIDEVLEKVVSQIQSRKNNKLIMFFMPMTIPEVSTTVINEIVKKFCLTAIIAYVNDVSKWGDYEYQYTLISESKFHGPGWFAIEYHNSSNKLLAKSSGRIDGKTLDPFKT